MSGAPQAFTQHPAFGNVAYRIDPVSYDPDTQVAQTIAMMKRLVLEDTQDPYLLMDAQAACYPDPINGIWQMAKERVTFNEDEATAAPLQLGDVDPVEVLIRPRDISRTAGIIGDCDDFSMWTACLLEANGIPACFCTVAADPTAPGRYTHVYVVAYPNGHRIPMDTSHGPYPGWEYPNPFRRREWPISGLAPAAMPSEGGCGWLDYLSVAMSAYALYRLLKEAR